MKRDVLRRTRGEIERAASSELDWVTFATRVSDAIRRVVPFERTCWHPVDPGTFLFTGGLGQNIVCSGPWLAEYEYMVEDVNKWSMLALTGQRAGSLSEATHGDLMRSARTRSSAELGLPIGDELRVSLVIDGTCWAAAGFLRDAGSPWFTRDEVRFLASLSPVIAEGFRKAMLVSTVTEDASGVPGVVLLDGWATWSRFRHRRNNGWRSCSRSLHLPACTKFASSKPSPPAPVPMRARVGVDWHRGPESRPDPGGGCSCTRRHSQVVPKVESQ